jgi:hypothetical protein
MRITEVESGDNYHITEMDQMQEIFNRYSDVTVIEKKRSTEGLLEQIYNKGERIYAFTIYYFDNELDPYSTDSYEISVNVEYASSISETIVAYYLQRREGIYVYYTETTVDEYNYFANIFETYEDAQ